MSYHPFFLNFSSSFIFQKKRAKHHRANDCREMPRSVVRSFFRQAHDPGNSEQDFTISFFFLRGEQERETTKQPYCLYTDFLRLVVRGVIEPKYGTPEHTPRETITRPYRRLCVEKNGKKNILARTIALETKNNLPLHYTHEFIAYDSFRKKPPIQQRSKSFVSPNTRPRLNESKPREMIRIVRTSNTLSKRAFASGMPAMSSRLSAAPSPPSSPLAAAPFCPLPPFFPPVCCLSPFQGASSAPGGSRRYGRIISLKSRMSLGEKQLLLLLSAVVVVVMMVE